MARLRKTLGESRGNRELIATCMTRLSLHGARRRRGRPEGAGEQPAAGRGIRAAIRRPATRAATFVGEPRAGSIRTRPRVPAPGRAGIGKTRVVEELERAAQLAASGAWGYCREAGDTPPLWPWLRLLRE